MSASKRPFNGTSVRIDETTPRVKLEPVGFVNTLRPSDSSIVATMRVVVVLPFVPETSTTPSGNVLSVRLRNVGSNRSTTLPGNALPP